MNTGSPPLRVRLLAPLALLAFTCSHDSPAAPPNPSSPYPNPEARRCLGIQEWEFNNGANLAGFDLRGLTLYGSDHYYSQICFDRANLSGANLEGQDTLSTEFKDCTFRKAILCKVCADWAVPPPGCDFSDADICGSNICLDATQLRSTWNYKRADLSHTSIRLFGRLPGFDFAGFDLRGTEFLASTANERVCFPGADFTDADIAGATIRLTAEQLRATKNYKAKDLSNTTLMGDFSGVSFRGFDLRYTTFLVCDLSDGDFTDADISGMTVDGGGAYDHEGKWTAQSNYVDAQFNKQQLYSTSSYQRQNLDCTHFHRCNFRDSDLSNQTLGLFVECDLHGANLTNADHVTGPSDRRAGRRSLPTSIGFQACDLSAEQFYSTRIYASKKFQPGCMMAGMNLSGWDFSGFDLRDVIFDKSTLTGANLENARGGDFGHAEGMTLAQFKSTWNYKHNKMHMGFSFRLPDDIAKHLAAEAGKTEK